MLGLQPTTFHNASKYVLLQPTNQLCVTNHYLTISWRVWKVTAINHVPDRHVIDDQPLRVGTLRVCVCVCVCWWLAHQNKNKIWWLAPQMASRQGKQARNEEQALNKETCTQQGK